MYYIIALFQLVIITPILLKLIDKDSNIVNAMVMCITPIYTLLAGLYNVIKGESIPLYATIFPAWLIYYYFGLLVKKEKINKHIIYNKKMLVLLLVLLMNIIVNCIEYKIGINYSYCTSQIKLSNIIYSLVVIRFILSLSKKLIKENKLLVETGNISFGIYFIHLIFIMLLKKVMILFKFSYIINTIIIFALALILSYISIMVFKKITKGKVDNLLGF